MAAQVKQVLGGPLKPKPPNVATALERIFQALRKEERSLGPQSTAFFSMGTARVVLLSKEDDVRLMVREVCIVQGISKDKERKLLKNILYGGSKNSKSILWATYCYFKSNSERLRFNRHSDYNFMKALTKNDMYDDLFKQNEQSQPFENYEEICQRIFGDDGPEFFDLLRAFYPLVLKEGQYIPTNGRRLQIKSQEALPGVENQHITLVILARSAIETRDGGHRHLTEREFLRVEYQTKNGEPPIWDVARNPKKGNRPILPLFGHYDDNTSSLYYPRGCGPNETLLETIHVPRYSTLIPKIGSEDRPRTRRVHALNSRTLNTENDLLGHVSGATHTNEDSDDDTSSEAAMTPATLTTYARDGGNGAYALAAIVYILMVILILTHQYQYQGVN